MIALLLVCATAVALAQTPKPAFDVVSIRPGSMKPVAIPAGMSVIGSMLGGPGTDDPESVRMGSVTLQMVLRSAYSVKNFQIFGPAWIESTRYDINAKVPAGATKQQYALMLQDMLEQRFNLKVHHETRNYPGYNLVIAKGGLKLKDSVSVDACSAGDRLLQGTCRTVGTPISGIAKSAGTSGMILSTRREGGELATARGASMAGFAGFLENQQRGNVVIDKTGLDGAYDIRFEYSPIDVAIIYLTYRDPWRILGLWKAPILFETLFCTSPASRIAEILWWSCAGRMAL